MDKMDVLYCQKVQEAIVDSAPSILTIFSNDAFEHDSYLELRYQPERGYADLYFCGISQHQIEQNRALRARKSHIVPPSMTDYWQQLDLAPALHHVRICGETLQYILRCLDARQVDFTVPVGSGVRDGCIVTVQSFWKQGFAVCFWVAPGKCSQPLAEVIWLLADYLPRPARDSLQNCLAPVDAQNLRKALRPVCPAPDSLLSSLQAIFQKGTDHAEDRP